MLRGGEIIYKTLIGGYKMSIIDSQIVEIDDNVTGNQWLVNDINELAKTIALITLGQVEHAAEILQEAITIVPVPSRSHYYNEARNQLMINGETDVKREVSRYHRDGFLFECISWIVSSQEADNNTYLKDPHISATTQGLDGLIIRMDPEEKVLIQTIICEDKCTQNPRDTFRDKVLEAFSEHHQNKRASDLLANAVALIKLSGLKGTNAVLAAEKVHDKEFRSYRAALTVDSSVSTISKRLKLFKGYEKLENIEKNQRIGATFIVNGELRVWFHELSELVIHHLNNFEEGEKIHV